ncbi:ABC transporter permease [Saccharicrinis sp. FJH2]|uniref:ABC transporter permease n=1 Tax=Saccharicrinis sp. FJH65 TaxID=3344659 RepID=UPI0035F3738D
MRTVLYIIQKEFLQILRNKSMLPIIFMLPVVQMMILVFAATFEMKEIKLQIIDRDNSTLSRELISDFSGSPFFKIVALDPAVKDQEAMLLKNQANAVLVIPNNFEKDYYNSMTGEVQLLVDAINGTAAELTYAYSGNILQRYNTQIAARVLQADMQNTLPITIKPRFWYNEVLDYKYYMAPGILVVLVTIIGMFLAGVNLVREREIGTIEQINVTPIKKWQFLAGKLIPFWIIGLFDLLLGLFVAWVAFRIPIRGSIPVLLLFASAYLLLILSLGLLVSTLSKTQQQVALMGFFFLIVFILMSGLFTPAESMPHWAQVVNYLNPLFYFVKIMRHVVLKGSGVMDLWQDLVILTGYGTVMLSVAVRSFRKTA